MKGSAPFIYTTNQSRVTDWVSSTFTAEEAEDVPERALRMAEEALELAQACGVEADTLHRLVDYVFGRPTGTAAQEIAGTMVTVYALAAALGADAQAEFEIELKRINQPEVIERCRRRQHEKRAALTPTRETIVSTFLQELGPMPERRELTPFEGAKKRSPRGV